MRNYLDLLEGELVRILALLREDRDLKTGDCGKLPVDVSHLRLEEGSAIARNGTAAIHNLLKLDGRQLEALRALVGVTNLTTGHVATIAVGSRGERIDHLQRIAGTDHTRHHAVYL